MWGPGAVLGARYELVERLGGGSMGEVWSAADQVLGRTVAVKVILPALLADEGFAQRFRAEARVMAMIDHPGVIDVYDYGEGEGPGGEPTAFLVMELISGPSLAAVLRSAGTLTPERTMEIVAQAASALQAVHDQGVIHRDVKPSNLMVRADGSVLLADFGIARSGQSATVTGAGMVLGSAPYLAPEAVTAGRVVSATDQYALGILAYQCLTGRVPFEAENTAAVLFAHVHEPLPPLPGSLPEAVRDVVERSLAKSPDERWSSAGAMGFAAARAGQAAIATQASDTRSTSTTPVPMATPPLPASSPLSPPRDASTHVANTRGAFEPATPRRAKPELQATPEAEAEPRARPEPRKNRNIVIAAAVGVILVAGIAGAVALSGSTTPKSPASDAAGAQPFQTSDAVGGAAAPGGTPQSSASTSPSGTPASTPSSPGSPTPQGSATVTGQTDPPTYSAGAIGGSVPAAPTTVPTTDSATPTSSATPSTSPTTSTAAATYTGVAGPTCASAGAVYREVGAFSQGYAGWYSETSGWLGDGCTGTDRFLPQSGTAKDGGSHAEWDFKTGQVQQGTCQVEVHIPNASGGAEDLGGGAAAHYKVVTGGASQSTLFYDVAQEAHVDSWVVAGSVQVSGGKLGVWLVDRGIATQSGVPLPAHFAVDVVRITCTS